MNPADRLRIVERDAFYLSSFAHGAVVNGLRTVEEVTSDYLEQLEQWHAFGDYTSTTPTLTPEEIEHGLVIFSGALARLLEQFPNDAVLFSSLNP